jgi:hypothetical protein
VMLFIVDLAVVEGARGVTIRDELRPGFEANALRAAAVNAFHSRTRPKQTNASPQVRRGSRQVITFS